MVLFIPLNETFEKFLGENISYAYKKVPNTDKKNGNQNNFFFKKKVSLEAVNTILNSLKTSDMFNFTLLSVSSVICQLWLVRLGQK